MAEGHGALLKMPSRNTIYRVAPKWRARMKPCTDHFKEQIILMIILIIPFSYTFSGCNAEPNHHR
jgi:hypothetical protein